MLGSIPAVRHFPFAIQATLVNLLHSAALTREGVHSAPAAIGTIRER